MHLLRRVDANRVVALTRSPEKVEGVRVRRGGFDDVGPKDFEGAERVLMISTDRIGARVPQHRAVIEAAAKAGVGQIVYTSLLRAGDPGYRGVLAEEHRATEQALAESGLPYTVLRNGIYPEMLEMLLPLAEVARTGALRTSAGEHAYVSYISRDDCAAVAATVLADGGYEGQYLDVTGPVANPARIAEALAAAIGEPVAHTRISPEADAEAMRARLPAGMVAVGQGFWRQAEQGWFDVHTHHVERLTGHPPAGLEHHFRRLLSA